MLESFAGRPFEVRVEEGIAIAQIVVPIPMFKRCMGQETNVRPRKIVFAGTHIVQYTVYTSFRKRI